MEDILVTLIIKLCERDFNSYKIQEYEQNCIMYMVNCSVKQNGEFTEKTIKECHAKKEKNL